MQTENTKGLANYILIFGFLIVVTLPMVFTLIHKQEDISSREKRKLAPLPAFSFDEFWDGAYQQKFSQFYQDHFGFRQKILSGAREFRRGAWNKSLSRNVIYGDDEWMYFNIDGTLHDYTGYYTQNSQDSGLWLQGLDIKNRWLAQLGVRYLLVPIPGKMNVYPEHLPARVRDAAGESRLQAFRAELKDSDLEDVVLDLLPTLRKVKNETQVYFKTDTHWNEDGAFIVYQAIMDKLSHWFDDIEPVTPNMIDRGSRMKMGDIAIADGAKAGEMEQTDTLTINNRCANEQSTKVAEFTKTPAYQANPKHLPRANGCTSKKIRALVVNDSFGAYIRKFLSDSFEEVIFMHYYELFDMKSFIEEFDPDVFIDLRAERRFHYLLGTDERMQSELETGKY